MNRVFYAILLIWLIVLYWNAPAFPNAEITITLLCLTIFSVVLFFLRKDTNTKVKENNIKHSTLFLVGYLVVHFQLHIDYLIGNIDISNYSIWVNNDIVIKALVLSTIGLICFFLGYQSFKSNTLRNKFSYFSKMGSGYVANTLFLEILAAIFLALYFFFINPLYLLGNYGKVPVGATAAYMVLAFEALMMAIAIQRSINMKQLKSVHSIVSYVKGLGTIYIVLFVVYLASVLISGDRGPIIYFSISIFGGYIFAYKNTIKIGQTLLYVFAGAYIISTLGKVRAADSQMTFTEKLVTSVKASSEENRFGYSSFLPQTQELATSIRTLHYAMDYVPQKEDYMYGRFQVQQIMSIVPFASTIKDSMYDVVESKYGGSSSYITWIDQGNYIYSGLGTTILADFYLDFGLLGVIIAMFFVGYIFRYLEITLFATASPSLFAYTVSLLYLSNSIYLSRSTFLIVLKAACWAYFFVLINMNLVKLRKR